MVLRIPCCCARCALDPQGFKYQTKQLQAKHTKSYPKIATPLTATLAVDPDLIPAALANPRGHGQLDVNFQPLENEEMLGDLAPLVKDPVVAVAVGNGAHLELEIYDDTFDNWFDGSGPDDNGCSPSRSPSPASQLRAPSQPPAAQDAPGEIFHAVNLPLIPDPGLDCDLADLERPSVTIPAFQEESYIRMAYLQAVMGNVFGNLTWERATAQLNATLDVLFMAERLPIYPRPVRTLISARRRLGMDPDLWIIQYTTCPLCWKQHSPKELLDLASPDCAVPNCAGVIYTVKDNKRIANLITPQVSIIESLRRMFMQPGFAKMVERKANHLPGPNDDENFIMKDIHDGDMWYKNTTGMVREVGNRGTVRDVANGQLPTKLFSHRFGLQITVNMDWSVPLENTI